MRGIVGIVLAGMMVSAGVARGDDSTYTVQKLLTDCNAPSGSPGHAFCTGFVSGVGGVMSINSYGISHFKSPQDSASVRALSTCGEATFGAEVQAFMNWAPKHPERWSEDAIIGVMRALRDTWPCTASQ